MGFSSYKEDIEERNFENRQASQRTAFDGYARYHKPDRTRYPEAPRKTKATAPKAASDTTNPPKLSSRQWVDFLQTQIRLLCERLIKFEFAIKEARRISDEQRRHIRNLERKLAAKNHQIENLLAERTRLGSQRVSTNRN